MSGIFNFIATWFGYTGSCIFSPDATCRPFLAFVALGAAASVGLVLVLLAYRQSQATATAAVDTRRARVRVAPVPERGVRATLPQAMRRSPPVRSELPVAV